LETDRRAALAPSEQKAEEAKLIKARQEGFQAAIEMLSSEVTVGNAGSGPKELGGRSDGLQAAARVPVPAKWRLQVAP
jgi:hypothetical protein